MTASTPSFFGHFSTSPVAALACMDASRADSETASSAGDFIDFMGILRDARPGSTGRFFEPRILRRGSARHHPPDGGVPRLTGTGLAQAGEPQNASAMRSPEHPPRPAAPRDAFVR